MTAAALPAGPVYLTLPREVLSAPSEPHVVEAKPLAPTTRAAHDPDAIRRLAALIDAAESPLLVTSASGRDPTTVQPLPTPATSVVANAWHHCLTRRV